MKTVLFLCTENSCRSLMAEAFTRAWGGGVLTAYSAGSSPSGAVNPLAVAVMNEKGIDISSARPKGFDELPISRVDYLVTMGCQDACPVFPTTKQVEWKLADPQGQPVEFFRCVRDDIEKKVKELIEMISAKNVKRDYPGMVESVKEKLSSAPDIEDKMKLVTNVLWEGLRDKGLDWVGFYRLIPGQEAMELVCRQPRAACSPIALHGVCGKGMKDKTPQIVRDVYTLGDQHIICDPANLSEIVVPLLEPDGSCRAVLDIDSRELGAFDQDDAKGLVLVLQSAGLSG
jgi:arsenate reductase (thioredoxin)